MNAPLVTIGIAGLLVVISLIQPLARRLRVAPSVLLAVVGVAIGLLATWLLYTPKTNTFNEIAGLFVNFPMDSQAILYVFLPLLLFQTTLTLDVRRMAEDGGVIFVMAVVAVLVATAFIGLALSPFTSVSLIACLLLGAIVATTDPVAVVAIFRDIGAPARLGRLVEGESLLNDAAAIALFTILLGVLTGSATADLETGLILFLKSFGGGLAIGYIGGQLLIHVLPLVRDFRLAQVTLSVALPYLVYVIAEHFAGVSGVVAVVGAGILINLVGPSRVTPDGWTYLNDVWEQIAFWASSLIFVLASILVPKLLVDVGWNDILLLAIVVVSALAARAVILYALLPVLAALKLTQPVSRPFMAVILWGGMRGAITLTLALGVTENPAIDPEVQRFVAVLATGFVLFTLLVYGTTLKSLIKLLKLDRLAPLDAAMRNQVLAFALNNVREGVARAVTQYHIAPGPADQVDAPYRARAAEAADGAAHSEDILDRDRVTIGLVAISNREREIVLRHLRQRTASIHTAENLLAKIGRIGDRARAGGRVEYNRAARASLDFPVTMRLAQWVQRRLKYERWLARLLADRYESLLLSRIVLDELIAFTGDKIPPLLGSRVGEILTEILANRREATTTALEALRLQYPDYADSLDQRFLQKAALRLEEDNYRSLFSQNLIGAELYSHLSQSVQEARAEADRRPQLDLGMRTEELTAKLPLFHDLPADRIAAISRLMRPRFAVPGDHLVRKGERGDAAYFISSGAVEVATGDRRIRLGRGECFGEIALLTGGPRTADVHALGYCHLLVLSRSDFRKLTDKDPTLRDHIAEIARERQAMNASPPDDDQAQNEADTDRKTLPPAAD
ncbi:cation:proton antiporter [Stappia taiwanensis]|uniref:Cation:proton antiporter n=1 Tax=Stappia taiwanensis TaxID=992267 RepID=A0A838XHE5_9HYPH|nr:cation:proton antiporter [Stappia taiwanensis]MBA4610819.1 cation:proton antiporter [Stappia taiwanensis]GGE95606.1 sodium:proton antiporter [Stappia taiwanensis]